MLKVTVGKGESLDRALRRFKKKVDAVGVLKRYKENQEYVKPSVAKRKRRLKSINRQRWIVNQEKGIIL